MIDEQTNANNPQTETTEVNYIEAMAEMRKNTVSKAEYNKVLEENKQLLNAMVNGETINQPQQEPVVDIDALRNDLFNREMTNLEYAEKTLQLRDELLKRGERDPFLPNGRNYIPNDFDAMEADRAAEALQHCIDTAQGNPSIFQNELQRILVDRVPVRKNINNRR